MQKTTTKARSKLLDSPYQAALVTLLVFRKPPTAVLKQRSQAPGDTSQRSVAKSVKTLEAGRKYGSNSWLQTSAHCVAVRRLSEYEERHQGCSVWTVK